MRDRARQCDVGENAGMQRNECFRNKICVQQEVCVAEGKSKAICCMQSSSELCSYFSAFPSFVSLLLCCPLPFRFEGREISLKLEQLKSREKIITVIDLNVFARSEKVFRSCI